jgi:hypothetical protein
LLCSQGFFVKNLLSELLEALSGIGWRKRSSDMEGNYECFEQITAQKQHWAVYLDGQSE